MRGLESVELREGALVVAFGEAVHRVRRNRDASLRVNLVDRRARGLIPIDGLLDADSDQMKVAAGDLLADDDHRTAGSPRGPSTEAAGQRLIVVGDGNHVEPDTRGVPLQHPRRQTTVADERVDVKVTGQHLVAVNLNRRASGYAVAQRADRNTDDEHRQSPRGGVRVIGRPAQGCGPRRRIQERRIRRRASRSSSGGQR